MKRQLLKSVMERVETWPDQDDLLGCALEIEARHRRVVDASAEDRRVIDEAIAAAKRTEVATDVEVEALFARCRGH
jgi:hypothetical protein